MYVNCEINDFGVMWVPVTQEEVTEDTLMLDDSVDPIDAKLSFLEKKINEIKAEIAQLEQTMR